MKSSKEAGRALAGYKAILGRRTTKRISRAIVALLAISMPTARAQAPARWIFNKQNFTADSVTGGGGGQSQIVTADFNKDGRLDLAMIPNPGDNEITSFLGNADGTFSLKQTITTGLNGPKGLAVGDFNNDGKLDLAVANYVDGTVSTYLGNGDGTFNFVASLSTAGSAWVVAGDFNGDGKLDVAVSAFAGTSSTVSILLGNGDGTFTVHSSFTVSNGAAFGAVGDFNGDGKLDLAVTGPLNNTVSVYTGNGDGTFTLKSTTGTGSNPMAVAASDLNGDGKLDLAVANDTFPGSVSILLGNGDGTFTLKSSPATGSSPIALALADLNGDKKLDLAVVNSQFDTLTILLGNGDGTFNTASGLTVFSGGGADSIVAGDFNRDGKLDLVVSNQFDFTSQGGGLNATENRTFSVFIGNGDGSFVSATTLSTDPTPVAVVAADFNNDGKLDVVVANQGNSGNVQTFLGNGDGTFTLKGSTAPLDNTPRAMAAADFNGDGNLDVAVAGDPKIVDILLGNGDGTFTLLTTLSTGSSPRGIAVGDFNGDGKMDVVVSNNVDGTLSVYLGNGDGTFHLASTPSVGSSPFGIGVGDFNRDGKLDLAVTNDTGSGGMGTVSILLGNGDGTFGSPVTFATNAFPVAVAVGDLNKDGKLDLAVAAGTSFPSFVSVLLGNGDGTFQTHVDWAVGGSPIGIVMGDFNGDGNIDLATADSGENASILPGNGDGTFAPRLDYAVNNDTVPQFNPSALAAGDFDKNGGLDLAVTNEIDNSVEVLLNNPVAALSASSLSFGQQQVGTTGTARKLTLTNPSGATLSVTSFTLTGANAGDFAETNTCGVSLNSGASCTISVTFTPTDSNTRTATLNIADSAKSSPQTVSLTGTGTGAEVTLSPTSLTFPAELVGTTSAAKKVTLSNTGNATLTITSIATSGDFAQTNTCGTSVLAGKNCTISVTFTPTTTGIRSGTLTVTDNDDNSPQTLSLKGTGTVVELAPATLNFGSVTVGMTSSSMSSTLTNTGSTALAITKIAITGTNAGDFAQTNTCGTSVPALGSCTITVTFTPTATGTRSAAVSITDNGGGSPQKVSLTGTGT